MEVSISKNENAYLWQALYFSFFEMPNLGGRNFLAHNVPFNYTMKIGAGHYVGLMASNLVENVKHMIIDKNSLDNPYIKAKCILQQVLKRL
jgi:hypothetical protein